MRRYDVLILGGGAAGLCLARHLERAAPSCSIGVLDARPLPGDPDSVRLGESVAEAASVYLCERLGLEEHLRSDHILKHGLRFFFDGDSLPRRSEFASMRPGGGFWALPFDGTNPPTFQLHRGRLEHHIASELRGDLLGGRRVTRVEPGSPHVVHAGAERFEARWVVDASASSLVPLGERITLDHRFGATWFWTPDRIDPDALSSDAEFLSRTPAGLRWRSTSHLMGQDYWVWLIPVPGGGTSVGIVRGSTDPLPDVHGWLAEHEPELGRVVPRDVVVRRRAVQSWRRSHILSDEGLAATGDAAAFLDPLYSSAFDLLAFSNELLVGAITASQRALPRACRTANLLYERVIAQYLPMYQGMYELMGSPRISSVKTAWDNAMYFGFIAPWMRSGEVGDELSFLRLRHSAERAGALQTGVQKLLRDWAAQEPVEATGKHFDQSQARFMLGILERLKSRSQGIELRRSIDANVNDLECLAVAIHLRASGHDPEVALNPYGLDLHDERHLHVGRGRIRVEPSRLEDIARCFL